jgi:hypothetical protein
MAFRHGRPTAPANGTGYDYATITYGPHGTGLRVKRYDGPAAGDDMAESIFVNALGEVYVTGSSEGIGTGKDYATVKYHPDGDGYGAPGSPECTHPGRDCDNSDPGVNPGDPEDDWEECHNGADDDWDGEVDEEGCFIATAVFGTEMEDRIQVLTNFRDEVLMGLPAGRVFVKAYNELSPPVARFIARRGWLRVLVRTLLLPLVGAASLFV